MSLPRPTFDPATPATPRKRAREPYDLNQVDPRVKRQLFPLWGLPRPVLNIVFYGQPTVAVRAETPVQRARRQFRARARRNGHVRQNLDIRYFQHEE